MFLGPVRRGPSARIECVKFSENLENNLRGLPLDLSTSPGEPARCAPLGEMCTVGRNFDQDSEIFLQRTLRAEPGCYRQGGHLGPYLSDRATGAERSRGARIPDEKFENLHRSLLWGVVQNNNNTINNNNNEKSAFCPAGGEIPAMAVHRPLARTLIGNPED